MDSSSSAYDSSFRSYDTEEDLNESTDGISDQDEAWNKLKKFRLRGRIWTLYKPIVEDANSLYKQFMSDPLESENLARWFVQYCVNKSHKFTTYVLYKFVFDCAAFQKFRLQKYFSYPPNVKKILDKADDSNAEVFKIGKYLFIENGRMAMLTKIGLCKFFQTIISEAYNTEMLYKDPFKFLFQLIDHMCNIDRTPLVITGATFGIKLVTSLTIIRKNMKGHNQINDEIINIIYLAVTKVCKMQVGIFKTFKLDYIKEMRKWIYYCGEVFLDYFDCLSVVIRPLLVDQIKVVRMATLDLVDKLTRSEGINVFIKEASVNELAKHVFCRFTDVDPSVALKAMEVYASLLERYIEEIEILPEDFHRLTETLYHIDYRFGSGCGKCLIEIMKLEDSDETHMLLNICKIAKGIFPHLKPLLVESLSDHTPVLENWDLYLTVFQDKCDIEVDISLVRVLSELLFESVCQVVKGKSSMERKNSKTRSVDKNDHRKIADMICPNLKSFLIIYRDEPVIAKNILKVVSKLEVDAIGGENLSYIESFLMISMKPFKYWEDADVVEAHLDFLNHVRSVSKNGENVFEELDKYCCEELLGSLKQEEYYLDKIKKLALVCKHIDLTEVLDINSIFSYDFRVESAEYNDEVLKLQSSIFVWRIKNLTTVSKEKQNENIEHFKYESSKFFLKCIELMGNEEISTKIKAFERYLDTSMNVCDVLEHAGKQIQGLDELKPSLSEDLIAQQQLIDVLELVLISTDIPVQTRQKYIANFVKIAGFGVLPMKIVSNIFKYYQKYDNDYGQLIEQILTRIWESEKNWVPVLVINSIALLYEAYIRRYDAIDIRSEDAKDILKLCRKFADFKMVSNPDCVVKIMYFAINYAIGKKSYDILLFVKVFTACLSTEKRNVLLDHLRRYVPAEDAKNDALLYFSNSLKASSAASRTMVTPAKTPQKTPTKRGRPPKLGKTERKQRKQSSTQKKKNNSTVKNVVDLTGEETRKRQYNTQQNENNSTVENDVDLTSEEST